MLPHTEYVGQLARAGFYYKPTSTSPDNVTCFGCEASLDGWQPSDEPAGEHLKHSPECGWAIYACVGLRIEDPNRREEDPSSQKMVDARLMTFRSQWPHESKKGWKCKAKKVSMCRHAATLYNISTYVTFRWLTQAGVMIPILTLMTL